jgi:hypothetical protein
MAARLSVIAAAIGTSAATNPCDGLVAQFVAAHFRSLGLDCEANALLYTSDAVYYHQHYGFKQGSQLKANCQKYGSDCLGPDGKLGTGCHFLQNGVPALSARGDQCHILVPYLWAELPANHRNPGNLEPHTGWEYIIAVPVKDAKYGYLTQKFAEIESSYAVPLNRAHPEQSPAVFQDSTVYLLSLTEKQQGRKVEECNQPLAPTLTAFFKSLSGPESTWRQQDDAVVLAAGDLCHVSVPFSAEVKGDIKSGNILLTLKPGSNYTIVDSVEFVHLRPSDVTVLV